MCSHTDDAFAFAAGPFPLAARARRYSGVGGRHQGEGHLPEIR